MMTVTAPHSKPPESLRNMVRELLTSSPEFKSLDLQTRLTLAQGLVKICATALELAGEERASTNATSQDKVLAFSQNAGTEFSGVAAQKVAGATQQILSAVSFPRFVTELINGVFKAMVDTNQQQMQSYVELIRNVAATTEGFADANVGLVGARRWLAERFPGSFVVEGEEDSSWSEPGEPLSPEEKQERDAETRLRLRPGAAIPSEAALRLAFGLAPQDSVPTGDPENLVPLARISLARNRQQMLSTMVMLGMQRIVIESGRLHASMRFHIDTRSAAQTDVGSQFDLHNTASGSGSFGFGPWGASASMTNTIGYVSTQKAQSTEEMNTDLNLDSSVELVFKTDYLPLERMAGREQVDRIKVNTLNPEAERKADTEARTAREKRTADNEAKRWESLNKAVSSAPVMPSTPSPGAPGSPEAADKARKEAEERDKKKAEKPGASSNPSASPSGQPSGQRQNSQSDGQAGLRPQSSPQTSAGSPNGQRTVQSGTPPPNSTSAVRSQAIVSEENVATPGQPDVIYVPSSNEVVDEMLTLAQLKPGELLYDLGCGDGRIAVAAAKLYGCKAVGFDIDPKRIAEARKNVARNHVEHLVHIEQRDIFAIDLNPADVVTVYLLPQLNVRLIPQIDKMKSGARIVSNDFDMEGIIPDRVVQIYLPNRHQYKTVYLWKVPLKKISVPVRYEWLNSSRLTNRNLSSG